MRAVSRFKLKGWRLHRGMTMQQLADDMTRRGHKISKAAVGAFEKGISRPKASTLESLAQALHIKPDDLLATDYKLDFIDFHELEPLTEITRDIISTLVQLRAELREWLYQQAHMEPRPLGFPSYQVTKLEEAKQVANEIRAFLKLDYSDLASLMNCIEQHGIEILELDRHVNFGSAAALSLKGLPFLAVQYRAENPTLQDWQVARGLTFFLIDSESTVDQGKFADHFAGEFVLPSEIVIKELGKKALVVNFPKLISLQKQYGIAIEIWLRRARQCKVINASAYRDALKRIKRIKRRNEPWSPSPRPRKQPKESQLIAKAIAKGEIPVEEAEKWLADSHKPFIDLNDLA